MKTEITTLPDDALFNVLRRLPPRPLAAARSVCKAWRGMVDDRGLLLRVDGIFINVDYYRPRLFARPAAATTPTSRPFVEGPLDFMSIVNCHEDFWSVLDHCSGLLLCHIRCGRELCVCNPATRQWTVLPGSTDGSRYAGAYLVFDPAVSPHYEVFLVSLGPRSVNEDGNFRACSSVELPPSSWKMKVFLSRTRRWEDRFFVREGELAGMVKDLLEDPADPTLFGRRRRYAVYLQGALYVHCRGYFVASLLLSDGKYQVIKTPANFERAEPYLGRSGNTVCFGIIHKGQLRVWILTESCGNMEWALKYQYDLRCYAKHITSLCHDGKLMEGPWTVKEYGNAETPETEGVEWDSDNDDILAPKIEGEQYYREDLDILGFHPYKEVVYLASTLGVMAFHLNSSRAQYLGISCPDCYYYNHITNCISESFVYTPSFIGDLHEGNTGNKFSNKRFAP